MANPKYKTPRSKTRKRRSHLSLKTPNIVACPKCHEPKLQHYLCWSCGTYKKREVIKPQAAKSAKESKTS